MKHEKIGFIIIVAAVLLLLTICLIQLPNDIEQTKLVNTNDAPVIFNDIISTNAHMNNVSYSNIAINATYGSGGHGGRFIPIQNLSYSPVNETFYVVAGGGGGAGSMGYYPSMITK